MVTFRAVAFDESGTGDEHRFMVVAGYVLEAFGSKRFSAKWEKIKAKYGVPYAHMRDAGGPSGVYSHLSRGEVSAMNKEFIEVIRKHTLWGFSVTVDKNHYNSCVGSLEGFPKVYTFLANCAISRVINWADATGFKGRFVYMFEAGAAGEPEADAVLTDIKGCAQKSERSRYGGHSFLPKGLFAPNEAADMLAWHVTKYIRDKHAGKASARKDFQALIRPQDTNSDYSESNVEEFKAAWSEVLASRR